jgi:hypothetical protein
MINVGNIVFLCPPTPFGRLSRARTKHGPFADHVGLYQGALPHGREVALFELLGRMTRVEFDQFALVTAG